MNTETSFAGPLKCLVCINSYKNSCSSVFVFVSVISNFMKPFDQKEIENEVCIKQVRFSYTKLRKLGLAILLKIVKVMPAKNFIFRQFGRFSWYLRHLPGIDTIVLERRTVQDNIPTSTGRHQVNVWYQNSSSLQLYAKIASSTQLFWICFYITSSGGRFHCLWVILWLSQ